ncbi:hypothetical protein G5B46_11805 [Caulobacter sp. 602-2]|uniref:Uncharacterized protein n=1 Tax=Caulobacter sp. 602-2 TaxID=2710887 RepID=A0A6G4QXS6_9CAUL|nr:hypothetical protein [Caulobacter sp. 602-2]NGM50293.1 hypothetical protein [Caulobacter sp. 602-2]
MRAVKSMRVVGGVTAAPALYAAAMTRTPHHHGHHHHPTSPRGIGRVRTL